MIFRLVSQEIRRHLKFSILFTLNLSLGLIGFLTLHAYQQAIQKEIASRSRAMLTADLSVTARRQLSQEENQIMRKLLPEGTMSCETVDFFSMVSGANRSRLVQVRAIEGDFPFYGELKLEANPNSQTAKPLQESKTTWISQDLSQQLSLKEGDSIKLGDTTFTVAGVIREEPSGSRQLLAMAPRLYVGRNQLADTKLLTRGSTAWYSHLIKLPVGTSESEVAKHLNQAFSDPAVKVETHQSAGEQISRLTKYLNDYLGLASLIGFFLSVVGASYLLRSYLFRRLKDIAILLTVGMAPRSAQSVFIIQTLFLSAISIFPALLISAVLLPLMTKFLATLLPFHLSPQISWESGIIAFFFCTVGNFLFCLPLLQKLMTLKPVLLLSDSNQAALHLNKRERLGYLLAFLFYWLLSVLLSHSWRVGSFFMMSFTVSIAFVLGVGLFFLTQIEPFLKELSLIPRLALRNLVRHKIATLSSLLTIGMGVGLFNLILLTQRNLQKEIEPDQASHLPSYFLFDIQEEQVTSLTHFLGKQKIVFTEMSPLIRARLISRNGRSFEKDLSPRGNETREEETQREFRNRGVNLSYRKELSSSESLSKGTPIIAGEFPPGISVEQDYAKQLGFAIGDRLELDIQGISVVGVIKNFRKVKWISFQPNFFIQFGSGVLEDAPKTYLTSLAPMSVQKKNLFQEALVVNFPNISAVDVSQVIERILKISRKVSGALQVMALLSLITGLVVIGSISYHQAQQRRWETALLKTLGVPFETIRSISRIEFFLIGIGAALLGVICASALSWIFSVYIFESDFYFGWEVPLLTLIIIPAACVLTSELSSRPVLKDSALKWLSEK